MKCALARFTTTPCRLRADGQLDPCHWIPKQRLIAEYRRREYPPQAITVAAMDRRVIVDGCRAHHDEVDGRNAIRKIMLGESDYPASLHEYAREFCWFFVSPQVGWVVDRVRLEHAPTPGLVHDFAPLPVPRGRES